MEQVEFSARASLVTIGVQFRRLNIWTTVEERVKIKQKVLTHALLDTLLDCFIIRTKGPMVAWSGHWFLFLWTYFTTVI